MKTMLAGLCATTALILGGCNAVYYYETEKVNLSLEARPDSSAPIQGNLGVKQRIAMVVPKRNGGAPRENLTDEQARALAGQVKGEAIGASAGGATGPTTEAVATASALPEAKLRQVVRDALADTSDSDAMDVVSSMRFHKFPKPDGAPWYKAGHMTIDGALITGGAARHVANPAAAIAALSGQGGASGTLVGMSAMSSIYESLRRQPATDARSKAIADELDTLVSAVPSAYPFTFYQPGRNNEVVVDTAERTAMGPVRDFRDVTSYWATLEENVRFLEKALGPASTMTYKGAPAVQSAELANELERSRRLRDQFRRTTGGLPVIRRAIGQFQQIF